MKRSVASPKIIQRIHLTGGDATVLKLRMRGDKKIMEERGKCHKPEVTESCTCCLVHSVIPPPHFTSSKKSRVGGKEPERKMKSVATE